MATDTATSGGCGALGAAGVVVVRSPNVRVVDAFVDVLHQQPATPPFVSSAAATSQQQQTAAPRADESEEDALNGLVKHQQHARLLQGGRPPVSPQARRPPQSQSGTPDGGAPQGSNKATGGSPKVQFAPSPPSGKPPAAPGNPQSNASPDRLGPTSRKTTGSSPEAMLAVRPPPLRPPQFSILRVSNLLTNNCLF